MKTTKLLLTAVAAGLVLLSCYMMPKSTTGNINFSMAGSRSITAGSDLVRVSLFSVITVDGNVVGQTLFTFSGGKTYAQGSAGSTISLSDIPAGTWAILVAAGKNVNGNFIVTDYSWPYALVTVAPGVDNPVTVTVQQSPVAATNLFGTDVVGVTNAGSVYAATSAKLYGVSGSVASSLASLAGLTVNGLDAGYKWNNTMSPPTVPYVDTNTGIYYYDGAIESDLATSNPIPVLQSGAFYLTSSPFDVAPIFQNSTGFGAADLTTLPPYTANNWVNFDSSKTIPGAPVYGFTTSQTYGYIASKLGAFRLSQNDVQNQSSADDILTNAKFFKVSDDSTILSLKATADGQPFYIGTSAGAWKATLAETSTSLFTGLTKIAATAGDAINKIASTTGYVAFLSQYNLYILDTGNGNVKTYPFYSGLPGQLTGLAWAGSGPATLYVSGIASGSTGGVGGLVTISGSNLP